MWTELFLWTYSC